MRLTNAIHIQQHLNRGVAWQQKFGFGVEALNAWKRIQGDHLTPTREQQLEISTLQHAGIIRQVRSTHPNFPISVSQSTKRQVGRSTIRHGERITRGEAGFLRAVDHSSNVQRLRRQSGQLEDVRNDDLIIIQLRFNLTDRRAKPIKNRMVDDHD